METNTEPATLASPTKVNPSRAVIQWSESCNENQILESSRENTWIQTKNINVHGVSDFFFRAGNKDYYLNPFCEDGEKISDVALKKKHG